ncbi:MAG: DUF3089 domain-containing protein [Cytophagaceae bacterium]|nr:DUF3089 domain-containing protein [Cytophagaceae bacterium]
MKKDMEKWLILLVFFWLNTEIVMAQKHFQITSTFDEKTQPLSPDYTQTSSWLALPTKIDMADKLPKGKHNLKDFQFQAQVDVFYVYPTVYTQQPTNQYTWNASTTDSDLNEKIEKSAIYNQATVFNGIAKIYTPIYRQAHYSVFTTKDSISSKKAMDLAYFDIRKAFEIFLEKYNHSRPFIIAGHSQGTLLAIRLIQEFVNNKPLQERMIAAYLVGMPVNDSMFETVKLMTEPNQTGGYLSWNTFSENYYPSYYENGLNQAQCINPVSWKPNTNWSKKSWHKGTLGIKSKLSPGIITCKVENGILWIKKPDIPGKAFLNEKIWHFADYNLFWLDIRENVALRTNQYFLNNKK